jgi:1-phosphatidylinositol-4-phosphate 5-kinase
VPPAEYADRFFAFMKAVMRGGEGGERFKARSDQAETKEKVE